MFPHENSLIPIFLKMPSIQHLEQIGTGVYVQMGSRSYLLTAGHVTDYISQGKICIPTVHGISPIAGAVASNILLSNQPRTADNLDIGCIRLDEEHKNEKPLEFAYLPKTNIDMSGNINPGDLCTIAGYPISRGKHRNGTFSFEVYSYGGVAAPHKEYLRLGYDPNINVLVEFRIKKAIFPEGDRVNPPHPRGLSGGGIFRLAKKFPVLPSGGVPRQLIGVMHSFLKNDHYFVGTRLPVYFENIYKKYPHEVDSFTKS